MKTKTLTIIATLMLSMGLIASNSKVTTDKQLTEYGSLEEKTLVLEGNILSKKSIIKYDLSGFVQEKTIYQWNSHNSSWLPVHKRVFSHSIEDQKLIVAFTKWDDARDQWSKDTKLSTYDRKGSGMLTMVESSQK